MIKENEETTSTLEYPKSQIFKRGAGLPSNNVFSNFRSRWHTCFMEKMQHKKSGCCFLGK